ncbi:MAG: hypothetical protein GOMPHAMPRED_001246 [Gomphillus americanus]|uniref:hydroxyisourate hydrolase n=1 Tax=Gomphillus americanus TaxID=1940652 RepID=A0A8H3IJ26_9LECA|nr:MAG: hypothetical protein GOMPHAMPRED_001246 [Gomphillus americanus]
MTSPTKALITTHILDQTTGRPAAGVQVHLHSNGEGNKSSIHVAAHTDADGRIGQWTEVLSSPQRNATEYLATEHLSMEHLATGSSSSSKADSAEDLDANTLIAQRISEQAEPQTWRLVFHTGKYFNNKTFWPVVELVVLIDSKDERGHWHVPLLLGPFGYTTYRGS